MDQPNVPKLRPDEKIRWVDPVRYESDRQAVSPLPHTIIPDEFFRWVMRSMYVAIGLDARMADAGMTCLSCGAKVSDEGELPCGH